MLLGVYNNSTTHSSIIQNKQFLHQESILERLKCYCYEKAHY